MKSPQNIIDSFISSLINELPKNTGIKRNKQFLELFYEEYSCSIHFFIEHPLDTFIGIQIPVDMAFSRQQQLIAIIQSKLHYTRTVYARNCLAKRISADTTARFINLYHLMGPAKAAYHYGLYDSGELVAAATFSKGRKMNRLEEHQRSFELVRFCCKEGISVSGGLSKLLKTFIKDKIPGDIMTYIDKQFSDGKSYYACGFKKQSESSPLPFLINKETLQRNYYHGETFNTEKFYLSYNNGNLKLIYSIEY